MSNIILNCNGLNKSYSTVEGKPSKSTQKQKLEILKDINLEIKKESRLQLLVHQALAKQHF